MSRKGWATVRLKVDARGIGEVVVGGIHMGSIVTKTQVFTSTGEATRVVLEILAKEVQIETTEEVKVLIEQLTLEDAPPLAHDWIDFRNGSQDDSHDICRVCRQVRRVAAPTCPGPKW